MLLVALAWLLAARHPRSRRPAAVVLGVGVLAFCSLQTFYALHKYATGAGAGPDAAARSWVDRHVPANGEVSAMVVSLGQTINYTPIWETAEFWNTSINTTSFFGSTLGLGRAPLPITGTLLALTPHEPGGLITAIQTIGGQERLQYILVPEVTVLNVGFDIDRTLTDPALLLRLERLRQPARLTWKLNDTSEEGFMVPGQPAEALVYSDALAQGARCASFTLVAPPGFSGRWAYAVLESGRTVSRGRLAAGELRPITVPLRPEARLGGQMARLLIKVDGSVPVPTEGTVSARVEDFAPHSCRERG